MDDSSASKLTWPALLAKQYSLDYHCHARPGAGNLQVLETLLCEIDDPDNTVALINWTWIDRFSFILEQEKNPWNPRGWCTLLPGQRDNRSENYYHHLHSQFRDKLETLMCMKIAIDYLRAQGMRFLMTYTDELVLESEWHTSPAISRLQDYVRPYLTDFDSTSYWRWIERSRFRLSDRWHPLEEAHERAADLISPVIDAILRKA